MNYWQVKAAVLERQLRMTQLQQQAKDAEAALATVLVANGLDPKKNYRLDDTDETATEDTPE